MADSVARAGLPVPLRASAPGETLEALPSLHPPGENVVFAPQALAIDALGRLFVLERDQGRITRISRDGGWVPFGAGDQGGGRYPNLSRLFAQWGPDLFALDPAAEVLYQFDLDGRLKQTVSYQDGLSRAGLGFVQVSDFALNREGELLLCDRAGGRLLLFDRFGTFRTDLSAGASGADRPVAPVRLAQSQAGEIFLLDPPGAWIRRFSREGNPRPGWQYLDPDAAGGAPAPLFCVTPWNQVAVVGRDGAWARLFDTDGKPQFLWKNPDPTGAPLSDLVAGPDSVLYLGCPTRGEIQRWRWVVHGHAGADPR